VGKLVLNQLLFGRVTDLKALLPDLAPDFDALLKNAAFEKDIVNNYFNDTGRVRELLAARLEPRLKTLLTRPPGKDLQQVRQLAAAAELFQRLGMDNEELTKNFWILANTPCPIRNCAEKNQEFYQAYSSMNARAARATIGSGISDVDFLHEVEKTPTQYWTMTDMPWEKGKGSGVTYYLRSTQILRNGFVDNPKYRKEVWSEFRNPNSPRHKAMQPVVQAILDDFAGGDARYLKDIDLSEIKKSLASMAVVDEIWNAWDATPIRHAARISEEGALNDLLPAGSTDAATREELEKAFRRVQKSAPPGIAQLFEGPELSPAYLNVHLRGLVNENEVVLKSLQSQIQGTLLPYSQEAVRNFASGQSKDAALVKRVLEHHSKVAVLTPQSMDSLVKIAVGKGIDPELQEQATKAVLQFKKRGVFLTPTQIETILARWPDVQRKEVWSAEHSIWRNGRSC
jgi:hypothetical protein